MAKLTAAQKKANVGFMDNVGTIYPAVMNQGSEKYYKNDGTDTGKLVYKTNPRVKLAFDTTVAASKAGIGTRIGQFSSDWNVGMSKGTFAVMLAPAWMMDYIKGQAPTTKGKWDIASVPGGGGNQGGSQLTIPKGAKHKQEAWNFISWYLAPDQQLKVFQIYGLFPSTPSLYKDVDLVGFKDPFFNNAPTGAIYAKGVQKLKPIFEGKLQRCIDMAMGSAISLVANLKEKVPAKAFAKGIADAGKCK
jgi:cellobiose transport system substrate-binding protein